MSLFFQSGSAYFQSGGPKRTREGVIVEGSEGRDNLSLQGMEA